MSWEYFSTLKKLINEKYSVISNNVHLNIPVDNEYTFRSLVLVGDVTREWSISKKTNIHSGTNSKKIRNVTKSSAQSSALFFFAQTSFRDETEAKADHGPRTALACYVLFNLICSLVVWEPIRETAKLLSYLQFLFTVPN